MNLTQILLTALVLGAGGTFFVRQVALRTGMVDQPAAHKLHLKPIPLLGGVAIYGGCIASLLLFGDRVFVTQLVGILVGASLMSLLGLWDDRRPLSPALKFTGQALITALLILTGVRVHLFDPIWLDLVVTAVWVLTITNACNLLDNMDGLAGGVAVVAAGFFLLNAALNGQYLVGSLSAALLGACLGFLFFNFNPARIFMGDAGSLFIGFILAVVGIKLRFPNNTPLVTWMVPVLILGVPLFDTALVTVSRLRRGVPVWQGGKDHTSHRLQGLGWTTRRVTMTLYGTGVVLGAVATVLALLSPVPAYLLGGSIVFALLLLGAWLEIVHTHKQGTL